MLILFLIIMLINVPGIVAMDIPELDPDLLKLPLSPRSKSPRNLLTTPVSSPRVSALSSPRRLSLTNMLKNRRSSLQKTFSSSKLDQSSPTRKRLSSSNVSEAQREKALILPPSCLKKQPISGEENQDNFKVVVFHARNRVCADYLLEKRAALEHARNDRDQLLITQLEQEIKDLNEDVVQFATEQRNWLVDQLLMVQE